MVRLNLQLDDQDFRVVCLLAERNRVQPGTQARLLLVAAATREYRRLVEAGDMERYPQGDLFPKQKGGKGAKQSANG